MSDCIMSSELFSRDERIYKFRGFGKICSDSFLVEYARKVTGNWSRAGWQRCFKDYYLGDYCLDEPKRSLTDSEYARLKELQQEVRRSYEEAERAREWKLVRVECYADNSEEEVWIDKDGVEKRVMIVGPHGD